MASGERDALDVNVRAERLLTELYSEAGDPVQALSHAEQALRLQQRIVDEDRTDVGARTVLIWQHCLDVAERYAQLGDVSAARWHLEAGVRTQLEDPHAERDSRVTIDLQLRAGTVLLDHGDYEGARSHFVRAAELVQRTPGPKSVGPVAALFQLGRAQAAGGDADTAVDIFADGLLTYCELVTPTARPYEFELVDDVLDSLEWVARECPDMPVSMDYAQVACETLAPVLQAMAAHPGVDVDAHRDRFERVRALLRPAE